MEKPRLLLADDHGLVVEALRKVLEVEFEIAGTVADGLTLLSLAPKLKPDVVILDLGMPLLNGMDAGERLKAILPSTKIIVLTMSEDFDLATHALRNWASGYLLKTSVASELALAIRAVLDGRSYITSQVAQGTLDEFLHYSNPERIETLTARQCEVLQLLAEGKTMKEAAAVLGLTARTIAFHKYRIMDANGLKTQSDLVRFAIRKRIVDRP